MSQYYNFKKPDDPKNIHYYMSEDLLQPFANRCDTQRGNMWASHVVQMVHLVNPEIPKVFTNFENQVGEYSVGYKNADKELTIVEKIIKNKFNYDLIVKDSDDIYDIIKIRKAKNITESYGYEIHDLVSDKDKGDIIHEGDRIYSNSMYDEDQNFKYGTNLNAVYLPYKNMTYEDAVVISESAAKKLKSYKVEETYISLNRNDIFINLYGGETYYKSFPHIGDFVKNQILCSRRRIEYKKALYDLRNEELNRIDHVNDDVIFSPNGMVVDIDLFSNTPVENIKGNLFNQEIKELVENERNYHQRLYEVLKRIVIKRENNYTDELGYAYEFARQYVNDDIKWKYDGRVYEHILVKFTVLKEEPLHIGSKLTGRYGNKGTISVIVPDEDMPITETGKRADICLNSLGVINRLNLGQLYEQYINHMSSRLLEYIKDMDTLDQIDEVIEYITRLNKEQGEFLSLETMMMSRSQKEDFMNEIFENGIYVHEYPAGKQGEDSIGNTTFDEFIELYKDKPYICEKYKFENIENPMIMGELYFVLLKHSGENKFSARSTSLTNIRNIPSKSTAKKNNKASYSKTPIRLGEMEVTNLFITKRSDIVERMLKTYSTSEVDRMQLVNDILASDNPLKINARVSGESSINRKVLNSHLNVLGLKIID